MRAALERVPDVIFPAATPEFTVAQAAGLPESVYVERPKLIYLDDEDYTRIIPLVFLDEIRILELLKNRPHPNIIRYHACQVLRRRVMGLVLDKHEIVLIYHFRDGGVIADVDGFMDDIRAGIEHLHNIGMAHNDLNPGTS